MPKLDSVKQFWPLHSSVNSNVPERIGMHEMAVDLARTVNLPPTFSLVRVGTWREGLAKVETVQKLILGVMKWSCHLQEKVGKNFWKRTSESPRYSGTYEKNAAAENMGRYIP